MGIGAHRGSSIMRGLYEKLQFEKRAAYLIIIIECNGAIHGKTVLGDIAPHKIIQPSHLAQPAQPAGRASGAVTSTVKFPSQWGRLDNGEAPPIVTPFPL